MVCPQCGANVPDGSAVCPACGHDLSTRAQDAPPAEPTVAMAPPVIVTPPKRRTGLIVAIVVGALLLLCVAGAVAAALFVPAIRDRMPWAAKPTPAKDSPGSTAPTSSAAPSISPQDEAAITASEKTVNAFYGAINAGDIEKVKGTLVPEVRTDVGPDMFEGWTKTTFEYTRGWVDRGPDGTYARIVGRESQRQFGAGEGGGVKFTLQEVDGAWLIFDFQSVDTAQVEGSDTAGSSTGIPGPLTKQTATALLDELLKARQVGAGNIIRRLASQRFLTDYGDVWLDGIDNSDSFTGFKIGAVKVSGSSATVVVTETWPDGDIPTTYGLVEVNGAVLVDSWEPQ